MIWIILATGFGAANFIAIALLFRRVRINTRQLSDMRAERNSEWILHALQGAPEAQERPARVAGGGSHTLPLHPRPVRQKRHLGLYRGGGILAAATLTLSALIRCICQQHRAHLVSTALGTGALAATTITVMTVAPWQQNVETVPPSSVPAVTVPAPPDASDQAAPTAPATGLRAPADATRTPPSARPTTPNGSGTASNPSSHPTGVVTGQTPADVADPADTASAPAPVAPTAAASPACTGALTVHVCLLGGD